MKIVKRSLAALLAVCCVLPMAACGVSVKPTDEPDPTAQPGPTSAVEPTAIVERRNYAVSLASYPETAAYPDESAYWDEESGEFDNDKYSEVYEKWATERRERMSLKAKYAASLDDFLDKSIRQFLSGSEGGNAVYSPLNVYMALAVLAETAGGNSRQQILDLLGAGSIEELRAQANALWRSNYRDDGAVTSLLANSLWLNEDVSFNEDTLRLIAEEYFASSFSGRMGDTAFDSALQEWINENTGGLLREQASGLHMDPQTIITIASTIYFRGKWMSEFNPNATTKDDFDLPDGGTLECDFMHKSAVDDYYWSDNFAAVPLEIEGSGSMWLILPDEGVSPADLLESGEATDFLLGRKAADCKHLVVNMSVPKFDVSSKMELVPGLKQLGVTDVFDGALADFTPLDAEGGSVTNVEHAARVKIDEEGLEAAAYTVIMRAGGAMPPDEEVDFTLDRPFLFAITGEDGLPLFVGVVNCPVE
jgi:serine protease inhibitor